jgi:PadR family transcriptional regulator PadR
MEQLERELKRGTLEMLLLRVLAEEPTWGYELVRRLESQSDGHFRIKEGTLYPILYRLEDADLIEPEWSRPDRGVPRKYYRLTTSGHERLDALIRAWNGFSDAVDAVLEQPDRKEAS